MSTPIVKGWCPGAHRPMMSGDGLVVRVRPFRAQLTAAQALALCEIAQRFGNGTLDLTSRANLQIRGVDAADHPTLLAELDQLGLIDADPKVEGHRNILIAPDWVPGDLTDRLYTRLLDALPSLPNLPEKMGFAVDTGAKGLLAHGSADFRFELDASGALMLRADGASKGIAVTEDSAIATLTDLAQWFVQGGGREAGRMSKHLKTRDIPSDFAETQPRPTSRALQIGALTKGQILGVGFGKIQSQDLVELLRRTTAKTLRLMLDRQLRHDGTPIAEAQGFVTSPQDPVMTAHACPGAPFCPQATVETMALAHRLAGQVPGSLHVSGCAKGCALPKAAALTLVGRGGKFDLVRDGAPWDTPAARDLRPSDLTDLTEFS